MIKTWTIEDGVYHVQFILVFGDHKKFVTWLRDRHGASGEELEQDAAAKCVVLAPGVDPNVMRIVIWISNQATNVLDSLIHESNHASMFVLEARGMDLSEDTCEAYAYYQTWIVREALRRILKARKAEKAKAKRK